MQPLTRGNAADANMPAAQNLLSDQRHHDGVIDVVVGRLAGCDILKREPGSKANDTGVARFERSVGSIVHRPKLANERFNDDLRWIEHRDNLVVPNFAEARHCVAQPKVGVCSLDTLYCGLKT